MKLHHNCTILRTFVRSHGTLNPITGKTDIERSETVTEPCGTPLFSGNTQLTGVCRECSEGWEHPRNTFANETERNRAMATRREQA